MNASESGPADGFRVVAQDSVSKGPAGDENFTGAVTRTDVLRAARPSGLRGNVFAYEAGARSNWHVHEGEQALIVTDGEGLVQWEGLEAPRRLRPGDWVHVVPDVPHWHGATPDSEFVHLAVTATGGTSWLGTVSEDEYLKEPLPEE